jgi:hypothetical protein
MDGWRNDVLPADTCRVKPKFPSLKPAAIAVAAFLVLGLMASLSYAAVGAGHREQHAATAPKDDADECATAQDGNSEDGSSEASEDQGDQGEDCDAEDPDDGSDESSDESTDASTDPVDPDREAACNEAAGVDPNAEPEPGDDEKVTGLDNAIQHVLANCLKNPQAPGLVNALEHLVANQKRHELHDAWKAEHEHGKPPWAGGGPPPWAGGNKD